jgi:class 3 adenylate cyclase
LNNNLTRLGPAVERELREAEGRRARTKSDEEQQRLHTELEAAYAQMERRVREITASIMFTDLEGSTAMLTRLGDDENQSLLEIHGEIIRRQVQNHGGLNVKNTGDGYMLAFYSARKAVSCAVEIQKDLQDYNRRNEDRQLKVRIGINVGETIKENDDYFGTAVVMAARIMDTASGGQILVSDLLQQIAYRPTDTEYSYSDFGRRTLKGLDQEAQIFEVKWGR